MPNYCILNFKTYNTAASIRAVQKEATREKEYDNIDKTRTHLNEVILGDMNYSKSLSKALKSEYYTKPDKYGRLHKEPEVKGIGVVLTYSPEAQGTFSEDEWIKENVKFLKELFPECPIHLIAHRDESSIHLQGMVIPTTQSGKINKSHYIRNKKELISIQDKYSERMKQFGLVRGEKGKTQNRDDKHSKQVRELRAQIASLTQENTKLRETAHTLSEALKTAQNALQEAQDIIQDQNELLWIKRTEPHLFKQLEQELNEQEH